MVLRLFANHGFQKPIHLYFAILRGIYSILERKKIIRWCRIKKPRLNRQTKSILKTCVNLTRYSLKSSESLNVSANGYISIGQKNSKQSMEYDVNTVISDINHLLKEISEVFRIVIIFDELDKIDLLELRKINKWLKPIISDNGISMILITDHRYYLDLARKQNISDYADFFSTK